MMQLCKLSLRKRYGKGLRHASQRSSASAMHRWVLTQPLQDPVALAVSIPGGCNSSTASCAMVHGGTSADIGKAGASSAALMLEWFCHSE